MRVEIELIKLRGRVYKRSRLRELGYALQTIGKRRETRLKGEERLGCNFCTFFQVRVSLTSVILIVNHLFLIGIEFGEDWDGFEN